MSESRHDDPPAGCEEISAAYRAADFAELPPPELDAAILAAARRSVRRQFNRYLPSLALAATVVLALGIVVRFGLPGTGLEDASAPAELRSAPAATEESIPLIVPQANGAASGAVDSLTTPDTPATGARAAQGALAARPACTPAQRAAPERWLGCIATQLDDAEIERAAAEYAEFLLRYPDYSIPGEIAATLGR